PVLPLVGPAGVWLGFILAGSGGWLVAGLLVAARRSVCHQVAVRVATSVGIRSGIEVSARRWGWGWPGVPARVRVRYPRSYVLTDPQVLMAITSAVDETFQGTYRISKHAGRRGVLILTAGNPTASEDETSPAVARAHRVVNELLGSSADIVDTRVDDDGEVSAMRVRHGVGTKLVASGYRARVERALSVMLPGRWRAFWDMEADEAHF